MSEGDMQLRKEMLKVPEDFLKNYFLYSNLSKKAQNIQGGR